MKNIFLSIYSLYKKYHWKFYYHNNKYLKKTENKNIISKTQHISFLKISHAFCKNKALIYFILYNIMSLYPLLYKITDK